MFNLRAALAIPLRSIYTGLIEFVLELFFPRDCNDIKEQKQFWDMLSIIIQQTCKSFHVIMDKELDDKVSEQMEPSDGRQNKEKIRNLVSSPSNESQEESSWTPHERDTQKKDSFAFISWDCAKEEPEDEFNVITHWENNGTDLYQEQVFSDLGQVEQSSMLKPGVERAEDFSVGQRCSLSSKRAGEKRQTKIEKTITLQILRQYFAGSLKDAAKSIGGEKLYHYNLIHMNYKGGLLSPRGTDSKSQSSSSSQNSGSAIYCSNEEKQLATNNGLNTGSSLAIEDPVLELRRTYSKAELYSLNQEEPKILRPLPKAPGHSLRDGVVFRVKATYGEENVRFGFLPNWGFKDLQQEIAKRFKIDDFSRIDLKYLDIDHEPVLLTCDADLEECIDLLSFSQCAPSKYLFMKFPNQIWKFIQQQRSILMP
ncbi:hypothetical protein GH714_010291 [Hevea brasiliensis]|uniref:PB1 domain-containing protein n=1 Tax=Hevea brasiliensis TaxID=3981 RepID=A0A6A6L2C1_HEVBR|nr:hypothetical protein GH714_010291 [Hevea brasiliensis]